jgi:hypothetical protein
VVKLVIAGSRTVSPTIAEIDDALAQALFDWHIPLCADKGFADRVLEVICGDAAGVDFAGEQWARARGIPIHHEPITAGDIAQHGKYVGPRMRNRRMAERGTHAIIFWDGVSAGSADMACRMVARSKPVRVVPCKPRAKRTRATR